MAGGTWKTQNKVRPGAYINTEGVPQPKPDTTTGRVLLANGVDYGWGTDGVIELASDSDFQALIGVDETDPKAATIREALKGAVTVLLVNSNQGEKATITDDTLPWTFTAVYAGTRGNDLTVNVTKDPADETKVTLTTLLGTSVVGEQVISTTGTDELVPDGYVDIKANDAATTAEKLTALTGKQSYKLVGGTNVTGDMTELLSDAMESQSYAVVTTAGYSIDSELHKLLATMIQRMRDDEGYKVTAVVPATLADTTYNNEAVTAVVNGVVLIDGIVIDTTTAAAYVAGVSSAIADNVSLTYSEYPEAVDVQPRLSNTNIIDNLKKGHFLFSMKRDGTVVVEQDINTLIKYTDTKPNYFGKNQTIRTLDDIANNTQLIFENQFIGKVSNNDTGRDLFKAAVLTYLNGLADIGAVENVEADDITIAQGDDKDAVLVTLAVQTNEAMEKLYMTINVK